MSSVDMKALFEAGAHFGHKSSRWHPKMAQYIHSKRNGTHIIDLAKTVPMLETALSFIEQEVGRGKQVLFVSTKKQSQDIVRETAEAVGMPYVTNRWVGGMLTNNKTMSGRIKYLKELEAKMASGELANKYNKLEVQRYQEEIDLMNFMYGGIKEVTVKPGLLFIVDVTHDKNAVLEATKLSVPIVSLVDSNADPTPIAYPIPCNDDANKAILLILDEIKQAVERGKASKKPEQKVEDAKS